MKIDLERNVKMYKENKEYRLYLYEQINVCFYWSDEKKPKWIISTTNFDYIDDVTAKLNFLKSELKHYKKHLSNDVLLSVIIDEALLQDKECNIVFNKENPI